MDPKVSRRGAMMTVYHVPVLVEEVVEGLITNPAGVYVDATFGGGGHSRAILGQLGPEGRLFGIDKDPDAPLQSLTDERFQGIRGDFRFLEELLEAWQVKEVAGILADLGISSHQVEVPARGFSYRWDAPLDLRMNPYEGEPAWAWLKRQRPEALAELLRTYGDLPKSRRLAETILKHWQPEFTTYQLTECAYKVYGKKAEDFLSPLFQAIRIAINDELGALEALLEAAYRLLSSHGRLVILTYHSGEARILKKHLHRPAEENPVTGWKRPRWKLLAKKTPSPAEIEANPRSRSATLWLIERV
ncbi:MAG: 16S rRNA (cytosine(1402)-N(4))-methyltransferase RsmH [Bacteroidia bacterium]|nr:16S rRNA (cytosine(1402)-N(4))-methyltransferase RsmH [Bacteroidia bacterium]